MHFAGSRTIPALDLSSLAVILFPGILRSRTFNSAARFCNSQFPFLSQYRQSSGWLESRSSISDFLARITRGEWVLIFIFSSTGKEQPGTSALLPSTSTTHILQAPVGERSFMLHKVGIFIPAFVSAERIVSPVSASI